MDFQQLGLTIAPPMFMIERHFKDFRSPKDSKGATGHTSRHCEGATGLKNDFFNEKVEYLLGFMQINDLLTLGINGTRLTKRSSDDIEQMMVLTSTRWKCDTTKTL